jgi:hypothetical protein
MFHPKTRRPLPYGREMVLSRHQALPELDDLSITEDPLTPLLAWEAASRGTQAPSSDRSGFAERLESWLQIPECRYQPPLYDDLR